MNRIIIGYHYFLLAAVIAGWSLPATIFAQESDPEAVAEAQPGDADQPDDQDAPREAGESRKGRKRDEAKQTLQQLRKLRAAMHKKLDLDEEQAEQVDDLFEEYFRSIKKADPAQSAKDLREQAKALRKRIEEAAEEGDRETMKDLRRELMELRRKQRTDSSAPTAKLIEKLAAVLDEEQGEDFREIVQRLELDDLGQRRDMQIRFLIRALRDPELELSEQQEEKIRELVREHLRPTAGEAPKELDREDRLEKLEEIVLAELTPEQRTILKKKQAQIKKRFKEHRRKLEADRGKPRHPETDPDADQPDDEDHGDDKGLEDLGRDGDHEDEDDGGDEDYEDDED